MTIQFNTDHNIDGNERLNTYFSNLIADELDRFSEHITRIEVHLTDENGSKEGGNDKRCVLEARVQGKQPIAVTSHGDTVEQAVNTALDKMRSSLDSIMSRMHDHHRQ